KVGRIHMVEKADTEAEIAKLKLGPEPEDLTFDYLQKRFDKTIRPIKAVLLDQGVIAGIGNIYADEILFAAKIHPEQSAKSLCDEEIKAIITESRRIMESAIEVGGKTIRNYTNTFGENVHYKDYLNIYENIGHH